MARILIAEDERPIRNLIIKNLTLVGHTCFGAEDGETASRIMTEEQLDLLILDVMLPRKSGFELIKEVENTPVIFVTAKESIGVGASSGYR